MPDLSLAAQARRAQERSRLNDPLRIIDPIVIATVAANLLAKVDFTREEGKKAVNQAVLLVDLARSARHPGAEAFRAMRRQMVAEVSTKFEMRMSQEEFLNRLTSGIPKIQPKTRMGWVKRLWPKLDWDGEEPPDLKASENWNELTVELHAEEIARLYHEEMRKTKSRSGKKSLAKKS